MENVLQAAITLCDICHLAWQKNLMSGWSGNASIRLPQGVLITAKGVAKGFVEKEDCLLINAAGDVLQGSGKPSSESALHLALYARLPESAAVLHTHPAAMQSAELATRQKPLAETLAALPLYEAGMWSRAMHCAATCEPGSLLLAESAARAIPQAASLPCAVWLSGHGLVAVARNLRDCLCLTEELEHLAAVFLCAYGMPLASRANFCS